MIKFLVALLLSFQFLLGFQIQIPKVTIPTSNVDLTRDGANTNETVLTGSKVVAGKFGLLGTTPISGYVFSQPLYVPHVLTSGVYHNLVIVATMNNSVYALDADVIGKIIWSNIEFATPYSAYPIFLTQNPLYGAGMGCLSTPVADVANSKLYVVCENNTPNWILRQLDLTSGSTLQSVTISGQVVGTGDSGGLVADTTSGSNLLFYPGQEFQRTGLVLANGNLYIGFASMDDTRPYHGWYFAYSTANPMTQVGIFCTSPNGWGGGIWMSGGAAAVDGSGNLYVTTGNGTNYDGTTTFTNSILKFSSTLTLLDWFTPTLSDSDDSDDADLASNRVMLIPGTSPQLAVSAGKDFYVRLVDTTCMGHVQGSNGSCTLQTFQTNSVGSPGGGTGSYGGVFMNSILYLPLTTGPVYSFSFSGTTFNTTPLEVTSTSFGGAAAMSGSINGSSNGILWMVTPAAGAFDTIQQGTLRAWNPTTLAEYYNSGQSVSDTLGLYAKFSPPLVANGKVYVATDSSYIAIYGIRPSTLQKGQVHSTGQVKVK